MLRIAFIIFLLFSSAAQAAEQESIKTIIYDKAEAELLLGRHPVTTYGMSRDSWFSRLGQSVIYEHEGTYYMHGGNVLFFEVKDIPIWGGGTVLLKGIITEIHNKGFIFDGIVKTERLIRNEWTPCIRQGQFEFSRDTPTEDLSDKENEDHTYREDFWRSLKDPKGYDPEGHDCDFYLSDQGYVDLMVRSLGFADETE